MHRRRLGSTSLELSVLGFGAAPLGDDYGAIDPAEGQRAVDRAIDQGINFFDVAPYYGRTLAEERLGRYLEGKRDRVVLATKVGRYDRDLPHGFDFSAERVTRSLEESLRRLRTDYLDLFLVHDVEFGRREQILEETLPAVRRIREQGKARYIGVTGYPLELLREVGGEGEVDVVLSYCHYNLLNRRLDAVLAPWARDRGVGLINASPLHMGVLTRQGPPAWNPAPARVVDAARAAAELCARRGADLSDLALRFAVSYPGVASTLVGVRSVEEVDANVRAASSAPDPELLAEVQTLLAAVQDVEWPSGLPENNPDHVDMP